MNKTAIKNYATWARTELIKKIAQKAYQFEVTETSYQNIILILFMAIFFLMNKNNN